MDRATPSPVDEDVVMGTSALTIRLLQGLGTWLLGAEKPQEQQQQDFFSKVADG